MGLMGTAGTLSIQFVLPIMGSIFDHKKIELAGGKDAFNALPPGSELDLQHCLAFSAIIFGTPALCSPVGAEYRCAPILAPPVQEARGKGWN